GAPGASNQPAGERTRLQNLRNEPNTHGRRHGLRTLQATQAPRVLTVGDQGNRPLLSSRFLAKRTHTPKWQKNDHRQHTPNEPSRQDGSFGPRSGSTTLGFDPGAEGHPPFDRGSRSAAPGIERAGMIHPCWEWTRIRSGRDRPQAVSSRSHVSTITQRVG